MATASAEAPTRASPPLFPPTLGKRKITIIPTGCILIIHRPISMLALTPLREQMSITHTPAIRAAATVPILSITILLVLLTGWGMKIAVTRCARLILASRIMTSVTTAAAIGKIIPAIIPLALTLSICAVLQRGHKQEMLIWEWSVAMTC